MVAARNTWQQQNIKQAKGFRRVRCTEHTVRKTCILYSINTGDYNWPYTRLQCHVSAAAPGSQASYRGSARFDSLLGGCEVVLGLLRYWPGLPLLQIEPAQTEAHSSIADAGTQTGQPQRVLSYRHRTKHRTSAPRPPDGSTACGGLSFLLPL